VVGSALPSGYVPFLEDLKTRIRTAQVKAVLSVNREMIDLYWHIGESIVERQRGDGWGKAVVERLSRDIQNEFPGIRGYSPQNIWYMRAFYLAWTDDVMNLQQAVGDSGRSILQQAVGELDGRKLPQSVAGIPWGQNICLLEKLKDPATRLWYARKTVEHGWSRAVLVHQIESGLHERQGKAVSNFTLTLPPPQSDLAQQVLKDPYVFDFLTVGEKAREREIERGLLDHVQKFLLELGVGFAFVGRQVHLEVDGEDFYLDLLFYHVRMHCYVVLELKAGAFKPEHAGKMNFYLAAADDMLRTPGDNPSIGIILCKTRKKLIAEYALKNTRTPIGVSQYELTRSIPEELRPGLPSIEELEKELSGEK
jgi:predicted nuclease of restriction endonuclease-like (RecB) superfamily